jgi:hypothetical protein
MTTFQLVSGLLMFGIHRRLTSMVIFRVVTPCGLVGGYQRFGGTYCLYLQSSKWTQYVHLKLGYPHSSPYGVTTQNITIGIFTALRTSNLTEDICLPAKAPYCRCCNAFTSSLMINFVSFEISNSFVIRPVYVISIVQ